MLLISYVLLDVFDIEINFSLILSSGFGSLDCQTEEGRTVAFCLGMNPNNATNVNPNMIYILINAIITTQD